ncbi:hypothetical protein Acr_27g0004260 [Actinidia rufa]|uniref:Uncharacterized protein n=1 Tax=Actinidia rufa TaxID=165716 RepID=A0A7J0H6F7_9ERIC|nr:hypothetical protein Acr_27g0004260 [Actinidia rufa]
MGSTDQSESQALVSEGSREKRPRIKEEVITGVLEKDGGGHKREVALLDTATTVVMAVDEDEIDVLLAASDDGKSDWVLDSGSAYHLCRDRDVFSTYAACEGRIWMANNTSGRVVGRGSVRFLMADGGKQEDAVGKEDWRAIPIGGECPRQGELLSDMGPVVLARRMDKGSNLLHRGTQSKRRVQDVHREAQRKEMKSILRSCTAKGAATPKRVSFALDLISGGVLSSCAHKGGEMGATITRKVTYFAAHPGGGCGAPQWGSAGHLGEKVQTLRCGVLWGTGSEVVKKEQLEDIGLPSSGLEGEIVESNHLDESKSNSQVQARLEFIWSVHVTVKLSSYLELFERTTSAQNRSLAKPGCLEWCGNVSVPYPFGIGAGCCINEMFSVECRNTTYGLKPYLKRINLEVFEISVSFPQFVRVNNPVISRSCPVNGSTVVNGSTSVDLRGSPFSFSDRSSLSDKSNIFLSVGCNNHARMIHMNDTTMAQCISICDSSPDRDNSCFGINCCQTTIPLYYRLRAFKASLSSVETNQTGRGVQPIPCTYAFLVDGDWFRFNLTDPFTLQNMTHVPAVLAWTLSNVTRNQLGIPNYKGVSCYDGSFDSFYSIRCECWGRYEGNPYLPRGCRDICLSNHTHPQCRRTNNNSRSRMIIIGQKPICFARSEESRSLATYFIQSMEENCILEILDPRILKDGRREEMIAVAHLGKRCLNLNGKKRPTMREVAIELEGIKMSQGGSTTQQNYHEEFEYNTTDDFEEWDIASSSTTGNFSQ